MKTEDYPPRLRPGHHSALKEAIQALERASQAPATEVQLELNRAERNVVQLRDACIARLRVEPDGADAQDWQNCLDHANQALSLIVGVEYPSSFVRRETIDQAKGILQAIMDG